MPSAAAERKIPSDGYYFDDGEDGYIVYEVADEAVGDGEKAVAILNGNILATDQAFYQIMYDDISENDLSYEEKTTNADGTPAACRQKNAQEFLAGKVPGVMAQYAPGLFSTLQHTHSAHPAPEEDADAVQQLVEWRENAPYG